MKKKYILLVFISLCIHPFSNAESKSSPQNLLANGFLFSISSELESHQEKEWVQSTCLMLHQRLQAVRHDVPETICIANDIDSSAPEKIEEARLSKQVRYYIHFLERQDGSVKLTIENWFREDDTDFKQTIWTISTDSNVDQQIKVQKHFKTLITYDMNKRPFRELLLLAAVRGKDSRHIGISTNGGYYDARRLKMLTFKEAYEIYKEEDPANKAYLLAAAEIAVATGIATLNYYFVDNSNQVDWDYQRSDWNNWRKRLLQKSWTFDSNSFSVNFGHAFSGMGYHWAARSSGLTSAESFLFAFAASGVWELICEHREKPSLNDQIITPIGGIALGEAVFQLGEIFRRGDNTIVNRVLSRVFAAPKMFNDWLNDQKLQRAPRFDSLGFPADVWHRFELYSGYVAGKKLSHSDDLKQSILVGAHVQILNQGDYDKAAVVKKVFLDTAFTELLLQADINPQNKYEDIQFMVKSVLAGYYKQDIEKDSSNRLSGYSFLIGPSVGLDYRSTGVDTPKDPNRNDWHFIANVLGATIDVSWYIKDVKIRFSIDVFGDFAMVRSAGYFIYQNSPDDPLTILPRILRDQNYFYGMGATTAGKLILSHKDLELGIMTKYHYISSLNGHDRDQQNVTLDPKMTELFSSVKIWFSHPLYKKRVRALYSTEYLHHKGVFENYSKEKNDARYEARIVFLF